MKFFGVSWISGHLSGLYSIPNRFLGLFRSPESHFWLSRLRFFWAFGKTGAHTFFWPSFCICWQREMLKYRFTWFYNKQEVTRGDFKCSASARIHLCRKRKKKQLRHLRLELTAECKGDPWKKAELCISWDTSGTATRWHFFISSPLNVVTVVPTPIEIAEGATYSRRSGAKLSRRQLSRPADVNTRLVNMSTRMNSASPVVWWAWKIAWTSSSLFQVSAHWHCTVL